MELLFWTGIFEILAKTLIRIFLNGLSQLGKKDFYHLNIVWSPLKERTPTISQLPIFSAWFLYPG